MPSGRSPRTEGRHGHSSTGPARALHHRGDVTERESVALALDADGDQLDARPGISADRRHHAPRRE